jgi:hypothetical protein
MIHTFQAIVGCRFASLGAEMTTDLEGVRLGHRRPPSGLQRLMSKSLARRSLVSYEIVEAPADETPAAGKGAERRGSARRRLRLRSAKLLDSHNRFICECLVRDESPHGLCLKLMKNVGLPARYRLYNDETGLLSVVATMWRRSEMLGVRYCSAAKPASIRESDRSALRGRYYAIPD